MAQGYDNRQGGRSSFAFEPAKVAQSQPSAQGGSRGVQLVGGTTSVAGGVAAASQFTEAGPAAPQIGGFLTELLQPAIDRRKKQEFVKGMVDQMSAVSGEEIRVNSKNPINQIFGPTSYEEGAIFYAAKDAVNKWQSRTLADMDRLKRLPPDQLTKVVAESFEAMKSGDQFTDLAVETSLIEASQPVIGAIAKERYKWQQGEARISFTNANGSSADALQATLTSLAKTGDPSDAGNLAANSALNNFRTGLQMPAGMDEETYKASLIDLYRSAAQRGNGYAVSALKQSGFLNVLNDEELVRLEDNELKYANRALGRAAMGYAEDINRVDFLMTWGRISATDAMASFATINEKIKAETGFDLDLFDYKDITGVGKSVWTAVKAQYDRNEDRKWQLEDAARREKFELERDEADAAREAAQVQMAWGTGRVKTAMAAGVGSTGNFDVLAQADYAAGNWSNMLRAYNTDQWVSGLVQSHVQAQVGNSIGQEYNKDFEQGYRKFSQLNKSKPAAAMAYYGDLYAPMLAYERMVTTGRVTPATAFARAFGNPAQYSPTPDLTKQANEDLDNWIKSNRGNTWLGNTGAFGGHVFGGRVNLAPSGQVALKNTLSRQLGVMTKNSDMPASALIPNLYEDARRSGAFEDYGRLGWSNKPGTPNLGQQLGLQQDEADEIVQSVVDRKLKATGFAAGINADNFDIRRIKDAKGNTYLSVTPYDDDDGAGTTALIGFNELKAEADKVRSGRVAKGRDSGYHQRLQHARRRIPGESGAARIARINREVAAGGLPNYGE